MPKPQPPELRDAGEAGPIPEDNQPGHHPDHDQDKPVGPPPVPRAFPEGERRYPFAFERTVAPTSFLVGVTPWTSSVSVTDDVLAVRFGLWELRTPLDNVEGAEVSGPYTWAKVAGPPHLSFSDKGVTFATTTQRGVCIRFKEPVRGLDPTGHLLHPAATVTVEDPDELAALLENRAALAVAS